MNSLGAVCCSYIEVHLFLLTNPVPLTLISVVPKSIADKPLE